MFRILIAFLLTSLMLVSPTNAQSECPLTPQLVVGALAQVGPGHANNLRDAPTRSATKIGEIPPNTAIVILDGPVCADGFHWWQIDYQGTVGWTVEGGEGSYWLNPLAPPEPTATLVPVEPVTDYVPHIAYLHNERGIQGVYDLNLDEMTVSPLAGAGNIGRVSSMTWFPDGQSFAYIFFGMGGEGTPGRLAVRSLDTADHIVVPDEAFFWTIGVSPDGRTLAHTTTDDDDVFVIMLRDFATGATTKVPLSEQMAFAAWSSDGQYILAQREEEDYSRTAIILAIYGQEAPQTLDALSDYSMSDASWSPDGNYLAMTLIQDGAFRLGLYEIATERLVFLTEAPMSVQGPDWSPDGSQIAYGGRIPGGSRSIYVYNLITGTHEQVTSEGDDYYPEYQPVPGAVTLDISPVFEVLWQDAQ